MTRIRCWEHTCKFNVKGICGAEEMEYHPDRGCLTYVEREGDAEEEEDVEDELEEEEEDWDSDEDGWEE